MHSQMKEKTDFDLEAIEARFVCYPQKCYFEGNTKLSHFTAHIVLNSIHSQLLHTVVLVLGCNMTEFGIAFYRLHYQHHIYNELIKFYFLRNWNRVCKI